MSDSDDLDFKDEVEEDLIEAPHPVRKTKAEQSTVFYDLYDKSYADEIENCDYTILGQIGKMPIKEAIPKLLEEFDHTPLNELIQNPSHQVEEFRKLIKSKLNIKFIATLTTTWPPAITLNSPSVEPIILLLVRMIHESADPERFLSWIASGLFDQNWYQKDPRSRLIAASLIKTPDNSLKWAVIDEDQVFYIFAPNAQGKMKPVYANKASRTKLSEDQKSIIVHGSVGEVIFQFSPKPNTLLEPWAAVFTKKRPPIWKFITANVTEFPKCVMFGIYKHFAQMDLHIVRALSIPGIIEKDQLVAVYSAILINASYTQKVPLFLHGILGAIFENPDSTIDGLAHKNQNLIALFSTMALLFGGDYIKVFGKKLFNYACSANINLVRDHKKFTIMVFTCLKYICSSATLLSPQLRLLISMTHSYICVKYNSERAVRRILGAAIGVGIISELLCSPIRFGIEEQMQSDTSKHIAKALSGMFSKSPLPPKYNFADWELRISTHADSQITAFINECCKLDSHCEFEVPQLSYIASAIRVLYDIVCKYNIPVNQQLDQMENNTYFTTPAGWALAGALSGFFERAQDGPGGHFRPACQLPSMLSLAPLLFPDKPDARAIATLVDHPLIAARPPAPEMFELQESQDEDSETTTTMTELYKPIIPKNVIVRNRNKMIDTEVSTSSDDDSDSYSPKTQKSFPIAREDSIVRFAPLNTPMSPTTHSPTPSPSPENRRPPIPRIPKKINMNDIQSSSEDDHSSSHEEKDANEEHNDANNEEKDANEEEKDDDEQSSKEETQSTKDAEKEESESPNQEASEKTNQEPSTAKEEENPEPMHEEDKSEKKEESHHDDEPLLPPPEVNLETPPEMEEEKVEEAKPQMPPPEEIPKSDNAKESPKEKEKDDSDSDVSSSDMSSLSDVSSSLSFSTSVSKKAVVK